MLTVSEVGVVTVAESTLSRSAPFLFLLLVLIPTKVITLAPTMKMMKAVHTQIPIIIIVRLLRVWSSILTPANKLWQKLYRSKDR